MLAKDLIDRLERLGLLDQEIIEALREQLAQSGARVTPEAVAKLLVDNGQLTRFQATKLIGELRNSEYSDPDEKTAGKGQAGDDLDLLDGDDFDGQGVEVVEEVAEVFDDGVAVAEVYDPNDEAVAVAEAVGYDGGDGSTRPRKVNQSKKVRDKTKSVWDSFWIYGITAFILILLFAGTVLYFVLGKGSADADIEVANKFYSNHSFDVAKNAYETFLKSYGPANPHSSIARTRKGMCELYLFSDFTDPARATKEAEKILPTIENERGMEEERNNLAALLVEIADNIAQKAGSAKETTEKQRLLGELDRQIKLIENPAYVTSAARTALAGQLLGVTEVRSRVQRDINRNLRLDEAVASMEASLKEKNTKQAYDTRFELLRGFPELEVNERIVKLVNEASGIQQQLVKPATDRPTVSTEPLPIDAVKKIVLTSNSGESAPRLTDEVVYMRVHGGVLALSAADGKLLWRRYVGYGQDHAPIAVNEGGQEGVLLSDSQTLEIQRTEGGKGEIRWRTKIGELFSQPLAYGKDICLSTQSGRLMAIDSETGEPRWVTQIPQPLEETPGINAPINKLYVTGDHSNLYVIDKRSGTCNESFYIGHKKGTCSVPPVTLQGKDGGHVFVFENAGVDYSLMHILKCNAEGGGLTVAQPPQRFDGNVMVSPIMVLSRRLMVLTDRGEVTVFDIEQTAKTAEQVSQVAKQVASYDSPTTMQMAVGKNQMWVSGTHLRRFELIVSTGQVIPKWLLNEGDTFIGSPLLIGETLIHSRVLSGTSGVRITAADPVSGVPYWQTDVGVPVSLITPKPDGKGFYAITSQADLFELNAQSLAEGATTGPIENAGGSGVGMRFQNPIFVDKDRAVMLNQESGTQICIYDPSREREKLRLISLNIPSARAGGPPIFAGEGLLMPLNSGAVMLMDWRTGKSIASPFQPPSSPNLKVRWTDAVVMGSDTSQVVVGDDRKKLYRLRAGEQIRELASVDLSEPLLGRLATIGDTIVGSSSGPSADFLVCIDGESLAEKSRVLLDGRIVWGPFPAGEMVLLQTDDGMLRGFDSAGKPKMSPLQLPPGQLIAGVLPIADKFLLTGRSGWLAVINPTSGAMTGKSDLGQPLSAPPLLAGKNLLVPGAEGLVYITTVPDSVEVTP